MAPSDRINLPELRKLAQGPPGLDRHSYSIGAVKPDALLALVEAVEAAARAIPVSVCDRDAICEWECQDGCVRIKAREALACFDFWEPA
jgi:hypothetical protein